jgi:hypothetical protein
VGGILLERKTKNKKLKKQKKKKINSGKITRELFQFIRRRENASSKRNFFLDFFPLAHIINLLFDWRSSLQSHRRT